MLVRNSFAACLIAVASVVGCHPQESATPDSARFEPDDGKADGSSDGSGSDAGTNAIVRKVDFNNTPLGEYTAAAIQADWGNVKIEQGLGTGRAKIIDGTNAFDGRSLRVKYPSGTHSSESNAIQFRVKLSQSYDELFLSYRVRFDAGFNFVKGGKLPGLTGGKGNTGGDVPTGTDGWSARMMWRSGGAAVQYVYHPDQPGSSGEDFPWTMGGTKAFPPGTWIRVEHRIVINTPGVKDGIIQGWWNGQPALNVDDLRFRDVNTFSIDGFYFSTFFGGSGSEWNATKDEYATFDDFIISTQPITH